MLVTYGSLETRALRGKSRLGELARHPPLQLKPVGGLVEPICEADARRGARQVDRRAHYLGHALEGLLDADRARCAAHAINLQPHVASVRTPAARRRVEQLRQQRESSGEAGHRQHRQEGTAAGERGAQHAQLERAGHRQHERAQRAEQRVEAGAADGRRR